MKKILIYANSFGCMTLSNMVICIYCAFESIKNEPKCEIKEIKEKVEEYKKKIGTIIDNTNNNLEKIKDCLKKFKKNKEEKAEMP